MNKCMRWFKIRSLCLGLAMSFSSLMAQTSGTCATGTAEKYLDVNNVRARILNTGGLFWNGDPNVYEVPKGGGAMSVFASGIWVSGFTASDSNLRMAAATYGSWEFWPGPLDADGNPPADCSVYNRLFKVSRMDLETLKTTGTATDDIRDWPWQIGAPVKDGDGNPNNYDLTKGDVPELVGDQMIWWVMNDVGNLHKRTSSDPIGLEVQVTAFAFNQTGDVGNTTFYRYKLKYKGKSDLKETMFSIFVDADLGNSSDDYVGIDTTLSLGYTYNSDDLDEGSSSYGSNPPAIGYDLLQGPLVNGKRLKASTFLMLSGGSPVCGDPAASATEYRYAQTARCRDGRRISATGDGSSGVAPFTNYAYPGDPVTGVGWSEMNTNGAGQRGAPGDRRFLMSTGPWTMKPGETQELIWAIEWAQSKSALGSLVNLRGASRTIQKIFDNQFIPVKPPDPPSTLSASSDSSTVYLTWDWDSATNNYADTYQDQNYGYNLEGYVLRQYGGEADTNGEIIAVYDRNNGVRRIYGTDPTDNLLVHLEIEGSDSGLRHHHVLQDVPHYRTLYLGVQAYGYNASSKTIIWGGEKRLSYVPTFYRNRSGGSSVQSAYGDAITSTDIGELSGGYVLAKIIDPTAITGDEYRVVYYDYKGFLVYDILNVTQNKTILNGKAVADSPNWSGRMPSGIPVVTADGLEFTVYDEPFGFKSFKVVANAGGPLATPEMGVFAFNASGFPTLDGQPANGSNDRPNIMRQQIATGAGAGWGIHTADNGSRSSYASFVSRTTRDGTNWPYLLPYDYEIRFTATNSTAANFNTGAELPVPFEVWNVGTSTPANTTDDIRLLVSVLENGSGGLAAAVTGRDTDGKFNLSAADHSVSGGSDDPFTDVLYIYNTPNMTYGSSEYNTWATDIKTNSATAEGHELFARLVFVNWDGGTAPPYARELPEPGTIFRIETTKPNRVGVIFQILTADHKPVQHSATHMVLDKIGVTPNPYRYYSAYETSGQSEVRFTDLPKGATVRVFSLDGFLLKTLVNDQDLGYMRWDLSTEKNRRIASGMYIIHITVPNVGERVLKFGVVRRAYVNE